MDKIKVGSDIVQHALCMAPFEGWNHDTLAHATKAAGYEEGDVVRIFPNGPLEAIDYLMRQCDHTLGEALAAMPLGSMKIRERIAIAVRLRISMHAPHREGLRVIMATLTLPHHVGTSLRLLYRTVDTIWYAAGDRSTDFNFYTKRMTLAAVYASTLLYWLNDKTPESSATWAFLNRRIENVMNIERAKQRFRQWRDGPAAA